MNYELKKPPSRLLLLGMNSPMSFAEYWREEMTIYF